MNKVFKESVEYKALSAWLDQKDIAVSKAYVENKEWSVHQDVQASQAYK